MSSNLHINDHQRPGRGWKESMHFHYHILLTMTCHSLVHIEGWTKPVARQTFKLGNEFSVLIGLRADQKQCLLQVTIIYLYSEGNQRCREAPDNFYNYWIALGTFTLCLCVYTGIYIHIFNVIYYIRLNPILLFPTQYPN